MGRKKRVEEPNLDVILNSSTISRDNKVIIQQTHNKILNRDGVKSRGTKYGYIYALKNLGEFFKKKPIDGVSKMDINNYLTYLRKNGKNKTETTKNSMALHKMRLKVIYQEMFNLGRRKYPECIDHITYRMHCKKLERSSLLTVEDINKLVAAADNFRDKAIIKLLYDSACRKTEIATLRIKDCEIDGDIGEICVRNMEGCKSGTRQVPIAFSIPELKVWLNHHPINNNPDAPLFVRNKGTNKLKPICGFHISQILSKLVKIAGLDNKRITCHLFRHSRLTWLYENGLGERELKMFSGHAPDSNVTNRYIHLDTENMKKAVMKVNGIKVEEKPKEKLICGVVCESCGHQNPIGTMYCMKCKMATSKKLEEKLKQQRKYDEMESLIKRFEAVAPVLEKLMENPRFNEALNEMKAQ